MNNFIDSIAQYLTGLTNPSVNKAATGYVSSNFDPAFKPKASSADYAPQPPPQQNFLDRFNPFGTVSMSMKGAGASPLPQVADSYRPAPPPSPVADQNPYSGWMTQQNSSQINPEVLSYLENTVFPLTRQYGIPDSLAAAQWAVEGGRQQKTNPFGLMFNGGLYNYSDLPKAVRDYNLTLQDILSANIGIPKDQFSYSNYDPNELLSYLQMGPNGQPGVKRYEGHMDNPQNYVDLIKSVPEWKYFYGK